MENDDIIELLPYDYPFLFVDEILEISDSEITGSYRYDESLPFYAGHFKHKPVTPGVILTETMAQIGLVSLGIYLLGDKGRDISRLKIALTSTDVEFLKPVYPNEQVIVISSKEYFRFNKLKCSVRMFNENSESVCTGQIAGMIYEE